MPGVDADRDIARRDRPAESGVLSVPEDAVHAVEILLRRGGREIIGISAGIRLAAPLPVSAGGGTAQDAVLPGRAILRCLPGQADGGG